MINTKYLRDMYEADRDDKPCPECGQEAYASDCFQIELLDQAPEMLDEIDRLRKIIKEHNIREKDGCCAACGNETNRGHCACPCPYEDCDFCK